MAVFHDPTFWVSLAFVALIAILFWMKVHRTVSEKLDARAGQIESDIREAENLREEAQDMLAKYQRKQKEAAGEAEEILQSARDEAERIAKQGRERLEATLERREKMAMDRIAQAEANATQEVRAYAVDVAIDAARAVVAEMARGAQADKMIDDAISGLSQRLH